MSKIGWLFLVPLIGLAVANCVSGCQRRASDEVDFGGITNSVYHNVYFGMGVAIPADWSVQDQTAQRELEATGSKMLYGNDQNKQAALKASELRVVNMFAVFKYPVGSPVPFNPSIIAMAEDVRPYPGTKTGEDYLYHVKTQLTSGQMHVEFPKPDYHAQLGGMDFDVMPSELIIGKTTVKQKYYVTIMKGYALSLIASYTTDAEDASLQKILDSVTFKPTSE